MLTLAQSGKHILLHLDSFSVCERFAGVQLIHVFYIEYWDLPFPGETFSTVLAVICVFVYSRQSVSSIHSTRESRKGQGRSVERKPRDVTEKQKHVSTPIFSPFLKLFHLSLSPLPLSLSLSLSSLSSPLSLSLFTPLHFLSCCPSFCAIVCEKEGKGRLIVFYR